MMGMYSLVGILASRPTAAVPVALSDLLLPFFFVGNRHVTRFFGEPEILFSTQDGLFTALAPFTISCRVFLKRFC